MIARSWKRRALGAALAALGLAPLPAAAADAPATGIAAFPGAHVLTPAGDAKALVVLFSDGAGWGGDEDGLSARLAKAGAFVLGIDLPAYLTVLEARREDECLYTVAAIEQASQAIQRTAGTGLYHLPVVAGLGAGGAMALAVAAQTPNATIGRTIAVDPARGIALKKGLCTPAAREAEGPITVYGLTDGPLPNPVEVRFTAAADAPMRAHVADLVAGHADIDVADSDDMAADALAAALTETIEMPDEDELGLPLTVLETKPTMDAMAIVYSGDGGWRDLDKDIGEVFQTKGVPTVGVDSLRYFWSEKTPEAVAADLSRIVEIFTKRWGVRRVVLVGYSFGADVLPTVYNLLKPAERAKIAEISLLALSGSASFQVSVSGWLGLGGDDEDANARELARIDPRLVQCIYGTDDGDAVCPALASTGIELVGIPGGHHFDGDDAALANRILDGLKSRLGGPDAAPKP